MTTLSEAPVETSSGDELAERLFLAGVGALELLSVHLGNELGLFAALREGGELTSGELADATGIAERYAREWLEQQAVASILTVDDASAATNARRYSLPAGHAEALLDVESLRYVAPIGSFLVSFASVIDEVVAACRTGGGVAYERYGKHMRDGQGAFNRPVFSQLLTKEWLPQAAPELHARLQGSGGARVADIACGVGWSSIALAKAYPNITVDGIDGDTESIAEAQRNVIASGVADRVEFTIHDASASLDEGAFDAVFIFEALHDMSQPVAALSAVRAMLCEGGEAIVMDERVADEFVAPGDEVERFMYAVSVLHCLPACLAEQPSAGTGTVLRLSTVERYASEAGFSSVEVLAVEHDFFRLYRLVP